MWLIQIKDKNPIKCYIQHFFYFPNKYFISFWFDYAFVVVVVAIEKTWFAEEEYENEKQTTNENERFQLH